MKSSRPASTSGPAFAAPPRARAMSTARLRSDRAAKVRPSLSTAHLTTIQAPSASLRDVLVRDASDLGLRDDAVTPGPSAGSQRRAATKAEPARGLSIVSSGYACDASAGV